MKKLSGRISYMGTKHELAPAVRATIERCQAGLVLDAFAGMGAVAESLADVRPVWTNDIQHFAHLASACRMADPEGPLSARKLSRLARPLFDDNFRCLREQNAQAMKFERYALRSADFPTFSRWFERCLAADVHHESAYGCFTKLYSRGYFSFAQAAQIDSIRYALEILKGRANITAGQFNWALFSLGGAALRVANTTGHFAQFLTPSSTNFARVVKQFRRNVWKEWLLCISRTQPAGSALWRRGNIATRADSDHLLRSSEYSHCAKVVYCDPPYTNDQYSRYYHVWETLVLYDYPVVSSHGRYRADRTSTDFCLKSKVSDAFRSLVEAVAESDADLILSYPSNGLLHEVGVSPLEIIRAKYPNATVALELDHCHSTMGGSKGAATAMVKERIYLARV